jgi:hypothetical protein
VPESASPTPKSYGAKPELLGVHDLRFTEYMHYMYLPVQLAEFGWAFRLPANLEFARDFVEDIISAEFWRNGGQNAWQYTYVTARRGFATPGNPLNRPGWHADGFGTDDINYVWTDRFPTMFAEGKFPNLSDDHSESMRQFTEQIERRENYARIYDMPELQLTTYPDKSLLRLDQFVVHSAPEIPAPGGERSFFKVSFSNERYALLGNSHNHLFDYDWPMASRTVARNDPGRSEADSVHS